MYLLKDNRVAEHFNSGTDNNIIIIKIQYISVLYIIENLILVINFDFSRV